MRQNFDGCFQSRGRLPRRLRESADRVPSSRRDLPRSDSEWPQGATRGERPEKQASVGLCFRCGRPFGPLLSQLSTASLELRSRLAEADDLATTFWPTSVSSTPVRLPMFTVLSSPATAQQGQASACSGCADA